MTGRTAKCDAEATSADRARQAYIVAVRLLGSRDHSTVEITRKLALREYDDAAIASTLAALSDLNYIDDERFARAYAERLMNQRRGPMAIRAKLRERGIDGGLANDAITALDADWVERAGAALTARFDQSVIGDDELKTRAKIARFLQSRGFSSGDSLRALQAARERTSTRPT